MAGGKTRAKIRRWWHGGDKQDENAANDVQEAANAQPAGNAAMIEELRANQMFQGRQGGTAAEEEVAEDEEQTQLLAHLSNLARALRESEKGGVGKKNSQKFEAVSDKLDAVTGLLGESLDREDTKAARGTLLRVLRAYEALDEACEAYLSRSASTVNGRNRQAIVAQILIHAKEDKKNFRTYFDSFMNVSKEERAESVSKVLEAGRRRKLVIADGKKNADLKHVGGAASDLTFLQKGDVTDSEVSGFFKKEETVTQEEDVLVARRIYEELLQKMPLEEKDRAEIEDAIKANEKDDLRYMAEKVITKNSRYWEDRRVHEFLDIFKKQCDAYSTSTYNLSLAGVELNEGDSIFVSRRNVAASRLANLLGVGDIIAQSETAELQDADGTSVGNLMQEAKGTIAGDALRGLYQKAASEGKVNKNDSDKINTDEMRQWISPEFIRSLSSLQVLDNLMGQVDRHFKNFMVDIKDGKLGGVQGIDNDMAFGHHSNFVSVSHARTIMDREKYDETNWQEAKLSIPYMDKALVDRLKQVEEADIRMLMADVLEPAAVNGLCKRLKIIQKAIDAAEADGQSGRFLEGDEAWGSDAVYNTYAADANTNGLALFGAKTYLGRYMGTRTKVSADEENEKLALVRWNRAASENKLDSPEQIEKFLVAGGADAQGVSYLKKTGQLTKDPGFLKTHGGIYKITISLANAERMQEKARQH